MLKRLLLSALLLAVARTSGYAQRAQSTFEPGDTTLEQHRAWTPLRIAKWTTLAGSTAAVVYGFSQNRQADREYASIEELCDQSPTQCTRSASNAYTDAALEQRYQSVVSRDEHARTALLLGQIGLVGSVVMFLIDLRDSSGPEDIPYEPKPFTVGASRRGIEFRWTQPVR